MNAYLPVSLKRGIGRSAKLLQASKLKGPNKSTVP